MLLAVTIPIKCKPLSNDLSFIELGFNKETKISYSISKEHFQFSTTNLQLYTHTKSTDIFYFID